MLAKVYTENYRNLQDGVISLRNRKGAVKQFIFLFGENGVGKSSFVDLFAFLKQSCNALYYNSRVIQMTKETPLFNLKEAALQNLRMGSNQNLVLIYELVINRDHYDYQLRLSPDGNIVSESLIRRAHNEYHVVFSATETGLYIDEKLLSQRNREIVERYYHDYGQDYTVLSIFYFAERSEKIRVKKSLRELLRKCGRIHIQSDELHHVEYQNIIEDFGVSSSHGYAQEDLVHFYKASSIVISEIVKSIYPQVDHVRYEFKREGSMLTYKLVTYMNTGDGVQKAHDCHLPSSYKEVLDFCTVFLDSYVGNPVVYDNVGRNFSPETLKYLLGKILKRATGQAIFTLNYPTLLNYVDSHYIYVFQKEDSYAKISSLEDIETIRENHNIRKRYESGVYDQFNPVFPDYNHYRLMEWFDKHVELFVKKSNGLISEK